MKYEVAIVGIKGLIIEAESEDEVYDKVLSTTGWEPSYVKIIKEE